MWEIQTVTLTDFSSLELAIDHRMESPSETIWDTILNVGQIERLDVGSSVESV